MLVKREWQLNRDCHFQTDGYWRLKIHFKMAVGVLLIGVVTIADADVEPSLKEGLWSIQGYRTDSSNPDHRAIDAQLCRNHSYDEHSRALAIGRKECSTKIVAKNPHLYLTTLSCTIGATQIVSTTTLTYQSDSVVHSESHTSYSPALQGKTSADIVQDQRYLGPCPANMKPGDTNPAKAREVATPKAARSTP
jgi:hypothetical protein